MGAPFLVRRGVASFFLISAPFLFLQVAHASCDGPKTAFLSLSTLPSRWCGRCSIWCQVKIPPVTRPPPSTSQSVNPLSRDLLRPTVTTLNVGAEAVGRVLESGFMPRPHQQKALEAKGGDLVSLLLAGEEWLVVQLCLMRSALVCFWTTLDKPRLTGGGFGREARCCLMQSCEHAALAIQTPQALLQPSDVKAMLLEMPCGTGKTCVMVCAQVLAPSRHPAYLATLLFAALLCPTTGCPGFQVLS